MPDTSSTAVFERHESRVRSYCRRFPVVFERAAGHLLWDTTGRSYIDLLCGAGALNYGHNPPAIVARVTEYLEAGGLVQSLDLHTRAKAEFLTRFNADILSPRGLGNYVVQFPGPAGTLAVEAALKLARKVTGRSTVVAFRGGFHGASLGALAVTSSPLLRGAAGTALAGATILPFPTGRDAVADLERALLPSGSLRPPAAIILETVQGEGGLRVVPHEWLTELRRLADAVGALVIVDDIQAGCGRTGQFFSFEHVPGLAPDLVCLSKSLSGMGLPMAALLIRRDRDVWEPGEHNGTFRGQGLAFVAATAAAELWTDQRFVTHATGLASEISGFVEGLAAGLPNAVAVPVGRGAMSGLRFADPALTGEMRDALFRAGVLLETSGDGHVLKLLPPLTMSLAEWAKAADRLTEVVVEVVGQRPRRVSSGVAQSPPVVNPLAGTADGLDTLRLLTGVTLDALDEGRARRGGPLPPGGPAQVAEELRRCLPTVLPHDGTGAEEALRTVVGAVAAGAADPADPLCVAHLHAAPLAVAAAADLAASVLNQSLDSWDQAPAAAELERLFTRSMAEVVHPGQGADAIMTTGGTESNLVALLLARQRLGTGLQVVCSTDAHHSIARAAWVLGLAEPARVPVARDGAMELAALDALLGAGPGPHLVVATAGTTNRGVVDPIAAIIDVTERHGGQVHVDAAYGGGLLFSSRRSLLNGIERAATVAVDFHKFGWQPLAAGLLTVRDSTLLEPLSLVADYLNATDDQQAGFPDLLGRSIRTSRRFDVLKLAVTFRAIGRSGLTQLTDRCCAAAATLAEAIDARPGLRLQAQPQISTVLFRPVVADTMAPADGNALIADLRRTLLVAGSALLGRATTTDGRLWLKFTALNPETTETQLDRLLDLVESTAAACATTWPAQAA